ncbi:exported hypothetical protein [Nitrospina gracilis 3/211]|uniref:Secreted protein n=1 Tax=Nitrospina gracilis (strain 3/211) TaxID=1266370 RepID=M1YJT6_NITG3|nr:MULTISPECIES: hypothetical protein [Nitrospina]MCF8723647.1 putative secreted protein with C-terminal beta-propeller domain [Nitrospina sp. Nb-3]CCQ90733.1 exported hypothetical protein [Nitrospina gracilis 3/211]
MVRKMVAIAATVLAFVAVSTMASANETVLEKGESSVCENASWIVYNTSETEETTLEFDIGPYAYAWEKVFTREIAPGGYQTNAIAARSTFTNKGPGSVIVNCQRQRFDRHDWKIDAGAGKTYQSDYHLDHVRPMTYIEPGLGMPQGTERGITGVTGHKPEAYR